MNSNIITYYNERAKEYDKVYQNPAEKGDLQEASALFRAIFADKSVLEIACGTGYWTEQIAQTALAVHATDVNEQLIEIAKARPLDARVNFEVADMYRLTQHKKYNALFGGFIWSHILLQDIDQLLQQWRALLTDKATIAFIDSHSVPGSNHDLKNISTTDEHGNTYQTRTLANGSSHLVLKNFPTQDFLIQKLSRIASDIKFVSLTHYWIVVCQV